MNYAYRSSESFGAGLFVWERFHPALKLEEEENSQEADEMERLKKQQRQEEEGKGAKQKEHEEPVLA